MPTSVIQMRGVGTGGTENAVATIDVPDDGSIIGVAWSVRANLNANAEAVDVELSFIATNQIQQNDIRGALTTVGMQMGLTTSGANLTGINHWVPFDDLRVSGGERLHMHIIASAGVDTTAIAQVHFDFRNVNRRSQRRR